MYHVSRSTTYGAPRRRPLSMDPPSLIDRNRLLTHWRFFSIFVTMFSGWRKSKQANYRTRIWSFFQLCHSYGSHAPLFFSPSMLILVGFVHQSELWQQVNADVPPLCQAMVAMRRVCLGRPSYGSDSKLWQSPCPPNWSGPRCKSRFLCCFKCFARFPGQPSRAVNVPNAQTSGGKGTLWCISLVYATTCAQNQNGTSHLQVMALLMALTANYVNRHAHQMGRSLDRKENRGAEK